ncbi:MAG: hypothetical protein JWN55_1277 [Frankiales bacterium]|nr:hypothetical protein [Frankiales bacterium]
MKGADVTTRESVSPPPAASTPRPALWKALLVGLAAGLLSGLFGVGGGILIVPCLVFVLHMQQRISHGTSLLAIVPIAASGLVGYATAGEVQWLAVAILAAGAAGAGAGIGTALLHRLPQRTLALCFGVLLLATAVRLLWETGDGHVRPEIDLTLGVQLLVLGVLSGVLAGLTGVGGGTVMVPAMVVLWGFPTVLAKGISLGAMIPTAIVGSRKNHRNGNLDARTACIIGVAGVASSYAGSQISLGLASSTSNRLFAALLGAVALKTFWDNRRGQA